MAPQSRLTESRHRVPNPCSQSKPRWAVTARRLPEPSRVSARSHGSTGSLEPANSARELTQLHSSRTEASQNTAPYGDIQHEAALLRRRARSLLLHQPHPRKRADGRETLRSSSECGEMFGRPSREATEWSSPSCPAVEAAKARITEHQDVQ